jgi:hypothetical protein
MKSDTKNTIPSIPSIPFGMDGRMGWMFLSPSKKGEEFNEEAILQGTAAVSSL